MDQEKMQALLVEVAACSKLCQLAQVIVQDAINVRSQRSFGDIMDLPEVNQKVLAQIREQRMWTELPGQLEKAKATLADLLKE